MDEMKKNPLFQSRGVGAETPEMRALMLQLTTSRGTLGRPTPRPFSSVEKLREAVEADKMTIAAITATAAVDSDPPPQSDDYKTTIAATPAAGSDHTRRTTK